MTSEEEIMLNEIKLLNTYLYNDIEYYNLSDLLKVKDYARGCNNSQSRLIKRKKMEKYCIAGRINSNGKDIMFDKIVSKRDSKRFVTVEFVHREFEEGTKGIEDTEEVTEVVDMLTYKDMIIKSMEEKHALEMKLKDKEIECLKLQLQIMKHN